MFNSPPATVSSPVEVQSSTAHLGKEAMALPHVATLPASLPRNFGTRLTEQQRRSPVSRKLFSASRQKNGGSPRRFGNDFQPLQDLGRGAFGRVIKVKHKLDGNLYAVKQLRIEEGHSEENKILREVSTLSRLSHPHVVRYYQAWIEEGAQNLHDPDDDDDDLSFESESEVSEDDDLEAFLPTNFLPDCLMNPSPPTRRSRRTKQREVVPALARCEDCQRPYITWTASLCGDVPLDHPEDSPLCRDCFLARLAATGKYRADLKDLITFSEKPPEPPMLARYLFIQMEYCQLTMVDMINERLLKQNSLVWNFLSQILEGLSYIHGQGIVHRDLKPANLFLSGAAIGDEHLSVETLKLLDPQELQRLQLRIGDFGLAKAAPWKDKDVVASVEDTLSMSLQSLDKVVGSRLESEVCADSGTFSYDEDSRESSSNGLPRINGDGDSGDDTTDIGTFFYVPPDLNGSWNHKADMYGVGIILFEMFFPCATGMERLITLRELRRKNTTFPEDFEKSNFEAAITIRRLLQRDPEARPSASELLRQLPGTKQPRFHRSDSSPTLSSLLLPRAPPEPHLRHHNSSIVAVHSMPATPGGVFHRSEPSSVEDERMGRLLSWYSSGGSTDSMLSGSFSFPDRVPVHHGVVEPPLSSSAPHRIMPRQRLLSIGSVDSAASDATTDSPSGDHLHFDDLDSGPCAKQEPCACCAEYLPRLQAQDEIIAYLQRKLEAKEKEVNFFRSVLGHHKTEPSPGSLSRSNSVGNNSSRVRTVLSPPRTTSPPSPEACEGIVPAVHVNSFVTPPSKIEKRKVQSARK